jgi:hypothetical protein
MLSAAISGAELISALFFIEQLCYPSPTAEHNGCVVLRLPSNSRLAPGVIPLLRAMKCFPGQVGINYVARDLIS